MKKALAGTLAAIMAFGTAGCSENSPSSDTSADHLARIQSAGKLIVGLEGEWQPFCFHDSSDKLVGFDVEVAAAVAEQLGVEVEYVETPWDTLFTGMDAGQIDMVVNGVDVTEGRKQTYDFTDPYAYDHTVLVVRTDETGITKFEDLAGKTTANSIGSTYMEIGESYGATVQGVDSLAETMTMVIQKQVDATINAETSVQDYIKTTGTKDIKVIDRSEEATAYAMPLPKGSDNASLLKAVNEALAVLRADGTLAKISEKYFGSDLTNE